MKQVKINLTDELDFNEYRKQICFFSQKITSFRREGNSLIIECEDNANTDKIEKKKIPLQLKAFLQIFL